MLSVQNLSVERNQKSVLHDVSLRLELGQTLSIVGESGAGKSTLIAAILDFIRPIRGTIRWQGGPVRAAAPALVMQEPRAAFNPVLTLRRSVFEPVIARKQTIDLQHLQRLCDGLELPLTLLDRKPSEVSIGQAQRVGILRALIGQPQLVLFDEPLSALDAVTQKQTAQLIAKLQSEQGFASLIVTHDIGYAVAFSDQIAVLKRGCIEEITAADSFHTQPQSAYGTKLRDAALALGALEQIA